MKRKNYLIEVQVAKKFKYYLNKSFYIKREKKKEKTLRGPENKGRKKKIYFNKNKIKTKKIS